MMHTVGGMSGYVLFGLLLLAVLVGVAVYLATRAGDAPRDQLPTAYERLQHRLADGEIGPEEYYERESALRSGEPVRRR